MQKKINQFIPSAYELWYVLLTSTVLLVFGCVKVFLESYGLISSSSVVREQFSSVVGNSLGVLDNFSITANVITFMVWCGIGLVVFSLVQAFVKASNTLKFERELSSNRYIHPASFNRKRYWKHIFVNTVLSLLLLTLLVVIGLMYLLFIVPVGLYYIQRFLLHPGIFNLVTFLVGALAIFSGTLVLYVIIKTLIWHHRVSTH